MNFRKTHENVSPKKVWGKLLTRLRESGEAALFVSCGEVEQVEISNNKLVAKTEKTYLFNLISSNENALTIKRALRFLGFNLDFAVEKLEAKNAKVLEDIKFLKDKFGSDVVIDE